MSVRVLVALLALLSLTAGAAPFAVPGASPPTAVGQASVDQRTAASANTIPPGTTSIRVQLETDGDASWTITTRMEIGNEAEREAFRELASRYENDEMAPPWLDKVRAANDAAERATGRSMDVTDVQKSSDVNNTTLRLDFTWTNFAREESDEMVVDDAFNTTRGTWLDGLTEDQILILELPRGYGVVSAPKGAIVQNAQVRWQGPERFDPGYMRVVFSGDADPGPVVTTTTINPDTRSNILWGGFFVLGLGIVAVGAYVFSQRRGGLPSPAPGDDDGSDDPATNTPASDDDVGAQTATAGTVEPAPEEPPDDVDEELLSDEERVQRLLESSGGRMKQANIVKETGWSNAKVSQLLSAMAEEGTIDKLRIGRENLISFPDEDVTDVDQN